MDHVYLSNAEIGFRLAAALIAVLVIAAVFSRRVRADLAWNLRGAGRKAGRGLWIVLKVAWIGIMLGFAWYAFAGNPQIFLLTVIVALLFAIWSGQKKQRGEK